MFLTFQFSYNKCQGKTVKKKNKNMKRFKNFILKRKKREVFHIYHKPLLKYVPQSLSGFIHAEFTVGVLIIICFDKNNIIFLFLFY